MDAAECRRRRGPWRVKSLILVVCAALVPPLTAAREAQSANAPFFLVATRNLPDPIFQQSVILMAPSTQPPLVAGIIINKPTTTLVRELFPQASAPVPTLCLSALAAS